MIYYKCLHSLLEDANAVQHLAGSHQDALAGAHQYVHAEGPKHVHVEGQQDVHVEGLKDVLNVIVSQKREAVNALENVVGLRRNPAEKANIKNIAKKVVNLQKTSWGARHIVMARANHRDPSPAPPSPPLLGPYHNHLPSTGRRKLMVHFKIKCKRQMWARMSC